MATTALARIDEEIIRHELVFPNLATQGNPLPFVFRLPTEILQTIFIHCARDYYGKRELYPFRAPDWVKVSYICRHWRDVALNCPTLWTYVCVTSQRWAEELLARSKQAPLKIILAYGDKQVGDGPWCSNLVVEKVMIHVERIEELCLLISDPFAQRSFFSLFSKSFSRASRLQNLEIRVDVRAGSEGSPVLFDGGTPALRTLKLSCCPVCWHSFRLSSLTTLSLAHVPIGFRQNVMEFRAVLSGMQDLAHLYLNNALASADGFLPSEVCNASSKINLPRLSRLLVIAPFSTVVALLSCVNIPLEAEVRLQCHPEPGPIDPDDYTLFSSLLSRRSSMSSDQALSDPTIRSLRIASSCKGPKFAFSTLERDCDSNIPHVGSWGRNVPLMIGVDLDSPTWRSDSLHVIDPPFSPGLWREILGCLQDLQHIKLSHGYMPDLASVLSVTPDNCTENQDGHADRGSDHVLAPALEKLELCGIKFSTGYTVYPPTAADLRSLRRALSTRKVSMTID